jgi:hypothetical protein
MPIDWAGTCSRNAVRRKEGEAWVDADAAAHLKNYAAEDALVVASSRAIADIGPDDTDPPHEDAQKVYVGIVGKSGFHSTCEYEEGSDSDPLTIIVAEGECGQLAESRSSSMSNLGKGLLAAGAVAAGAAIAGAVIRKGDRSSGPGDKRYA